MTKFIGKACWPIGMPGNCICCCCCCCGYAMFGGGVPEWLIMLPLLKFGDALEGDEELPLLDVLGLKEGLEEDIPRADVKAFFSLLLLLLLLSSSLELPPLLPLLDPDDEPNSRMVGPVNDDIGIP